jgi:hypothetical protein
MHPSLNLEHSSGDGFGVFSEMSRHSYKSLLPILCVTISAIYKMQQQDFVCIDSYRPQLVHPLFLLVLNALS